MSTMPRVLALIGLLLLASMGPVAVAGTDPIDAEGFYTLVPGDEDPSTLVAHMRVTAGDPFREILFWNPQVHDVYGLAPGMRLRVPGRVRARRSRHSPPTSRNGA